MCAISPCLLTLPWYVPDRCQRHSNEEDQLQRQLVQRQLAWTRRQTEQGGGSHTGMWRGVHGSAGPALCMYDRDRLSEQRVWLFDSVSAVMWKHTYACGGVFILFCQFWHLTVWSVSFLFLAIPLSLPSYLTHLKRTADAILGHLLFGMLHLPARTASLSLSLSLFPPSALLAAG